MYIFCTLYYACSEKKSRLKNLTTMFYRMKTLKKKLSTYQIKIRVCVCVGGGGGGGIMC